MNSIIECPKGFNAMTGDITHWLEPYETTMEKCASDCINLHNCKSFSHDFTGNLCKLMTKRKRTGTGLYDQQGLYGYYQYCTRGIF